MNFEKIKKSINDFEGFSSKVYNCPAGKKTIGFGRNLEDKGISKKEAYFLLENDLLDIKLELEDKLHFFHKLDDVRQNVLIEMAYNMGVPRLLQFKKTLYYIENYDFQNASIEMLKSKWHRDFIEYAPNTNVELLRSSVLSKLMNKGEF